MCDRILYLSCQDERLHVTYFTSKLHAQAGCAHTAFFCASIQLSNSTTFIPPKNAAMPPKSRKSVEQEGRLLLAISAVKESHIKTV